MFEPYKHQRQFADNWHKQGVALNFDNCGTGKTLSCIHAVQKHWPDKRVLVLAPLSILSSAWGGDLAFAYPSPSVAIASGTRANKIKAFESGAQWVVTNHDTIKLVIESEYEHQFDIIIVDEADQFRNLQAKRTKSLIAACRRIPIRTLMTGTPTPKSITDIFALAYACDFGERLGTSFTNFRRQVCDGYPIYGAPPGAMKWVDKPEATTRVMGALHDIATRVTLDEVTELPDTIVRSVGVDMPTKLARVYRALEQDSLVELETGVLNGINAGARVQKMLQTCSGAIYDEDGTPHHVHGDRYELVLDLATQTDHSLVAFNWTHQRDGLLDEARKRGIDYAYIDGSVPVTDRNQIVEDYQNGKYQVLFCQPQSAGHGLTLTRANRIVWASPTYRADLYEQFNHRIIRNGQKRKTEIIHVAATESIEDAVYEILQGKRVRMFDLLDAVAAMRKEAA